MTRLLRVLWRLIRGLWREALPLYCRACRWWYRGFFAALGACMAAWYFDHAFLGGALAGLVVFLGKFGR
jgi:hypothetical protein